MAKVGRNKPCPCKSGKKFKHCCLKEIRAIKNDIANGAQYVKGVGPFGVVKIKDGRTVVPNS